MGVENIKICGNLFSSHWAVGIFYVYVGKILYICILNITQSRTLVFGLSQCNSRLRETVKINGLSTVQVYYFLVKFHSGYEFHNGSALNSAVADANAVASKPVKVHITPTQ